MRKKYFFYPVVCTSVVGYPTEALPQSGLTSLHILPQLTFPCSGNIHTINFHSSLENATLTIGIGRWLEQPLELVKITELIQIYNVQTGKYTVSLKQEVRVIAGDFIMLIPNETPTPVSFTNQHDIGYIGDTQDLVYILSQDNHSQFTNGDIFDMNNLTWVEGRYEFSLSLEVDPTETSYKKGMLSKIIIIIVTVLQHEMAPLPIHMGY